MSGSNKIARIIIGLISELFLTMEVLYNTCLQWSISNDFA